MNDPKVENQLPEHDLLVTRPDGELPAAQDLKAPTKHPTDPKPSPPDGQGTDPKAGDLGRAA
jgi:hypothetical protein